MKSRLVPVNERGDRIGEGHQRATLSDAQVEVIRDFRDTGMTYGEIVRAMAKRGAVVSKSHVAMLCRFERREQYADRWKRIVD